MPFTWLPALIDKIARRPRRGVSPAEEALLDIQIRSYLRSEYAKEAPPSHVLPRLMRAVHLHREEQQKRVEARIRERVARNIGLFGHAFTALYHTLGRGDTSRIISSGLVTGLILLAMWPSMKHLLASNYLVSSLHSNSSVDGSNSNYSTEPAVMPLVSTESRQIFPSAVDEERSLVLEQRVSQDATAAPASEDPTYLHPLERGLGNRKATPLRTDHTHERPIIGQE